MESVIKKVSMLLLTQQDVDEAVTFYKKLGLGLAFHIPGKWAEFLLGSLKIGLCPTQQQGKRRTGIVLEVDDCQKAYEKMKVEGVTFLREPVVSLHGIMASFEDPGGNIIDIYQATPEKLREAMKKKAQEQGDCKKGGGCKCSREAKQAQGVPPRTPSSGQAQA